MHISVGKNATMERGREVSVEGGIYLPLVLKPSRYLPFWETF